MVGSTVHGDYTSTPAMRRTITEQCRGVKEMSGHYDDGHYRGKGAVRVSNRDVGGTVQKDEMNQK